MVSLVCNLLLHTLSAAAIFFLLYWFRGEEAVVIVAIGITSVATVIILRKGAKLAKKEEE